MTPLRQVDAAVPRSPSIGHAYDRTSMDDETRAYFYELGRATAYPDAARDAAIASATKHALELLPEPAVAPAGS